jgi:hypothetical protein
MRHLKKILLNEKMISPFFLLLPFLLWGCGIKKVKKTEKIFGNDLKINVLYHQLVPKEVSLTDLNKQILSSNRFVYGQSFRLAFRDVQGFVRQNESIFPGLKVEVLDSIGRVVFSQKDIFEQNTNGFKVKTADLYAEIAAADPMHTGNRYTLRARLWDKKAPVEDSVGIEISTTFEIVPHPSIQVFKTKGLQYDEIYYFNEKTKQTIVSDTIPSPSKVYVIVEGLKGFKADDLGNANVGISLLVFDSLRYPLVRNPDIMTIEGNEISLRDFEKRIFPNFALRAIGQADNPIYTNVQVWSKHKKEGYVPDTLTITRQFYIIPEKEEEVTDVKLQK